jgi:hypothetical protein
MKKHALLSSTTSRLLQLEATAWFERRPDARRARKATQKAAAECLRNPGRRQAHSIGTRVSGACDHDSTLGIDRDDTWGQRDLPRFREIDEASTTAELQVQSAIREPSLDSHGAIRDVHCQGFAPRARSPRSKCEGTETKHETNTGRASWARSRSSAQCHCKSDGISSRTTSLLTDLGSRSGDEPTRAAETAGRTTDLLLRSPEPVAAWHQRKHEWPVEAVLPEGDESQRPSTQRPAGCGTGL